MMSTLKNIILVSVITSGFITNAGELKVTPLLQKSLNFKEGKIGQAVEMTSASRLVFKSDRINADGGTIEVLTKPQAFTKGVFSCFFSVGRNNPLWFLIGVENDCINFTFRKKTTGGKYEYYASIKSKIPIKDTEWTHLAIVWGFKKEKECILQIYVNGKAVDEKFDQTFGTNWDKDDEILGVGCSSASGSAPAFNGLLDELRISNYPKKPSEIKTAYNEIQSGKAPALETGTLLLLHFDENADGLASDTAAIIPPEEMAKISEKVLNEVYPE